MSHGPHDNCAMCRMARTIGMMEKHPKDCNCYAQTENKSQKNDERKKANQTTNTI